jgi:DNA-directed RNA polymerase omega subunit
MPQNADAPDPQADADAASQGHSAVPLSSRFLFVDVAAQRAKQLRRGALPRLDRHSSHAPHKLERIAMEEVRNGLVHYALPVPKTPVSTG